MDEIKKIVRETYQFRCGYCGVHEEDVGALLTIDHHRPKSHSGSDKLGNLVYCCTKFNEHKGSYWHETDRPYTRLLHPKKDDLRKHIREEASGQVVGLTKKGKFFIKRLHLSRPLLVAYRLKRHTEQQLKDELRTAREREQFLLQRVEELDTALQTVIMQIQKETK